MQECHFELAVSARSFIETRSPPMADPPMPSTATCRAARWVSGVPRLTEHGPDLGPYGFFTGNRWESHAWVLSSAWIIDITADQFGADPVTVAPCDDERYRAGDRDTALPAHVAARHRAVEDAWPYWLAYRREKLAARR